ncbi:MAG: AAA family ATPase, partial [Flavobacteriales bacterium]|nr:AAA family ATPase [Flavobacteriales bacterium]
MELLIENDFEALFYKGNGDPSNSALVKILKDDHPTVEQLARLNNEYEITNSLNIDGVCKAIKKTRIDNKEALLFEHFKGSTLKERFVENRRSLKDFLKVAIQISEVLGELHQHNIIHKDINSNTILVAPDGSAVRIIDFSISSKISLRTPHLGNPDKLEGTLAYISPEQTGRMNRMTDHRTDLYSLGVTFYEILTGTLPFSSSDSMELVHSHLAKTPERPEKRSPEIPVIVSDIVMKLLSKNAEDRYSSAWGLKDDLEECLDQLNKTGSVERFTLGSKDYFSQFKVPEKLYGREMELKELMEAFDRVSAGSTEMMLVAGYSGVGKSALINEVQKPITEKRGHFISGKFDQYQRVVPYYAIVRSFKEFVNQLLTEDEDYLNRWQGIIQQAVGAVGKVLTDVIPNLELILGHQPEVPELGGIESQNRFTYVFRSLLKAIATA